MFYRITLCDINGCEMARNEDVQNLRTARAEARAFFSDPEYTKNASHVLIENDADELVDTVFAPKRKGAKS
jgi:hypothetical protein